MEVLYDISSADHSQQSGAVFPPDIDPGPLADNCLPGSEVNTASGSGTNSDFKPTMRSLVKAYLPNKMKTSVNCMLIIVIPPF